MLISPHLSLLLAAAQAAGPAPAVEVLPIPGGPELAVVRTAAPEVASIRVAIPLTEEETGAGAGFLLAAEADARMRELAEWIGASAEARRTPHAVVYHVAGAVSELDHLASILREGMGPPEAAVPEASLRRLRAEHERRLETPRGVLAARLREALAPSAPSVFGTAASLDRMSASRLLAVWDHTHLRGPARVVVAGSVPPELALLLVNDLGLRDEPSGPAPAGGNGTGSPPPVPEVIRHWVALGYRIPSGEEAGALVAARFLGEEAAAGGGDFEVGIEIWETGGGTALVVTGAAYARSREAMEARLGSIFAEAARSITEEDVRRLSDALRTEVLLAGRTAWGLAELVGQAWDAGRGTAGAEELVETLEGLAAGDVIGLLGALESAAPVREELRP